MIECDCGANLTDDEGAVNAICSFYDSSVNGDRADLHAQCPECGLLLELEASIIESRF